MRRALTSVPILLAVAAIACGGGRSGLASRAPGDDPERLHRIFDFTPVSESNPVVARVDGTPVEIPVSEFSAYLAAEMAPEERARLGAKEKEQRLQRLIDEELLLWEAYGENADKRGHAHRQLEATRTMLLAELLTKQEVDDKATSKEEHARLRRQLRDRLFDKAQIVVSNESWAALQEAVARKEEGLTRDVASLTLATCLDRTITVGDIWNRYAAAPADDKPAIATREGLVSVLRDLTEDTLKVAEARARGLEGTRAFREKVETNRAALTRMAIESRIAQEAAARGRNADADLRRFYERNLGTRYTYSDAKGKKRVVSFSEERESIRNDYVDDLRERLREQRAAALRKGRQIEIDLELAASA